MRKLTLGAIALAASTMMGSTASHATFMIQGWTDTGSAARMAAVAAASLNATIGQTQTGGLLFGITPDIMAATNTINYFAPPGSTAGDFLTSGGTPCGSATCIASLQNSYWLFTSTDATTTAGPLPAVLSQGLLAQNVSAGNVGVRHDDGVQLDIGRDGIFEINLPGPQSQTFQQVPFAGMNSVALSYGENSGLPAVLQANLTNAVPEPASLALLGSALVGFGVMRRRRKTS